jgi:hypothetical protein
VRELVRTDLPELAAASDRVRALVAGASLPFALLAGIGAERVAGDVVRSIAVAVLAGVQVQNAPRPYDVQQILGPAFAVLVARRAGGAAGAFAYVGYSAFIVALSWLGRFLTCNSATASSDLRYASFCSFKLLDLLPGALPLVVGLAIGGVAATRIGGATRIGTNALLEGAGAYAAFLALVTFGARAFVVNSNGVPTPQVPYFVAVTVISGVLAGATIARRSRSPVRSALVLVLLFVVTWLYPIGASQIETVARTDWQARPELFLVALPLLDAVTIPLAARLLASRATTN